MAHHLYPVAQRMLGRHVYAHHVSGRVYPGILQSANPRGIYLIRTNGYQYVSLDQKNGDFATLDATHDRADVQEVYGPAAFFGFGALTGLTLGALASRPYYGYGYGGYGGYGYGGYGGYGYGGYPYYW